MSTIGYMPTTSDKPDPDRHKPSRMARLPESLCCALDLVAALRLSTTTAAAVDILRNGLESLGAWPLTAEDIKKIHAAIDKKGKPNRDELREIAGVIVARNRANQE